MKSLPILFFTFLLATSLKISAQFSFAQIGIDGLTCSACSRSVEMSIRKLPFVDSVIMNLEHTQGKIIFKKGVKVEIEKIAKAVINAGFSVRSLYATINIDRLKINNDFCWMYENDNYHFIKVPDNKELKGIVSLKFIGEKYMPKKEFKTWKMYCNDLCNPALPVVPTSKKYDVSLF